MGGKILGVCCEERREQAFTDFFLLPDCEELSLEMMLG